jgi:ATP-dependent Clp protease ATP-binding subunit ClpC
MLAALECGRGVEGDAEVRYTAAAHAALRQADAATLRSPKEPSSWRYHLLLALLTEQPRSADWTCPHAYEILLDLGVDITTLRQEIRRTLARPDVGWLASTRTDSRATVLGDASFAAELFEQEIIGTAHLLCGLLRYPILELPTFGPAAYARVLDIIGRTRYKPAEKTLSPEVIEAQLTAHLIAAALGYNYVGTEHVLLALLESTKGASRYLTRGTSAEQIRQRVLAVTRTERLGGAIPRETAELKVVYSYARQRGYSAHGLLTTLAQTRNSVARGALMDFEPNLNWPSPPPRSLDTRPVDPPKPTLLSNPYSDDAKRVLVVAQSEARELGDAVFLESNHVLLGMLRENCGIATTALERSGIEYDTTRQRMRDVVHQRINQSEHFALSGSLHSMLCVDAVKTARKSRSEQVEPEHVLLTLIKDPDGNTARTLTDLGANTAAIRRQVKALLAEHAQSASSQPPAGPTPATSKHASARDWASTQAGTLQARPR